MADAMVVAISLISPMVLPIASIEPTDFCVAPWIAAIWEAIFVGGL